MRTLKEIQKEWMLKNTKIAVLSTHVDFNDFMESHPQLNKDLFICVSGDKDLKNCIENNIQFTELRFLYDANLKTGYEDFKKKCLQNMYVSHLVWTDY